MFFFFLLKLNIPEGPEYENTSLINVQGGGGGGVKPDTKTGGVKSKFSEKGTYQNSENVHNFLNTWPGFT